MNFLYKLSSKSLAVKVMILEDERSMEPINVRVGERTYGVQF